MPFDSDSSDNERSCKDKVSVSSPSASSRYGQSPSSRNDRTSSVKDRNSSSLGESSRHSNRDNNRQLPRDSYRSPRPPRARSPIRFAQSPVNRSRSPIQRDHIQQRSNDNNSNRSSADHRHSSSVFDRMSSPPMPKRRYVDSSGASRRSIESSHSNGSQFLRTVNGGPSSHRHYDDASDAMYQNVDPQLMRPLRDRSPLDPSRRFIVESNYSEIGLAPRAVLIDENIEVRSFRERLIAAETHCIGLESTVSSYAREILKLRSIVNALIEDFDVIQNRLR